MKHGSEFRQVKSSTPRDLADINRRLMSSMISPEVAEKKLWGRGDGRANSWEGARGPLFGPVSTSRIFVVYGENRVTRHDRESIDALILGHLGNIGLIGVDLEVNLGDVRSYYRGKAIAAEFNSGLDVEGDEGRFVLMSLNGLINEPEFKQARFGLIG